MSLVVAIQSTRTGVSAKAELPLCNLDQHHVSVLADWVRQHDPEIEQVLAISPSTRLQVALEKDSNRGHVQVVAAGGHFIVATFSYRVAFGGARCAN